MIAELSLPAKCTLAHSARRSTKWQGAIPVVVLLKKAAGIKSGSGKPNKDKVGKISRAQLQEIAQTKAADMTGADIEAMTRSIEGTARSRPVCR